MPPEFCIAIEAKRKVSLTTPLPIKLYYWKKENLQFGITQAEISGHNVRITDLERSVCDVVKYRNKVGMELCGEVIRNYLKRKDRNLSLLSKYSKQLRVAKTLNTYIEINMGEWKSKRITQVCPVKTLELDEQDRLINTCTCFQGILTSGYFIGFLWASIKIFFCSREDLYCMPLKDWKPDLQLILISWQIVLVVTFCYYFVTSTIPITL